MASPPRCSRSLLRSLDTRRSRERSRPSYATPRSARKSSSRSTTRPALSAKNSSRSYSALVSGMGPPGPAASRALGCSRSAPKRRSVPPPWRSHSREQHLGDHGLHHVVVGTQLEARDLVEVVAACREHEYQPLPLGAQRPQHTEAIEAREHQVEHHEVGRERRDALDRRVSSPLAVHAEPVALESRSHHAGQRRGGRGGHRGGRRRGTTSACSVPSISPASHRGVVTKCIGAVKGAAGAYKPIQKRDTPTTASGERAAHAVVYRPDS